MSSLETFLASTVAVFGLAIYFLAIKISELKTDLSFQTVLTDEYKNMLKLSMRKSKSELSKSKTPVKKK